MRNAVEAFDRIQARFSFSFQVFPLLCFIFLCLVFLFKRGKSFGFPWQGREFSVVWWCPDNGLRRRTMSSYNVLSQTDFETSAMDGKHGAIHKMLKYWRNTRGAKVSGLKKSASFTNFRYKQQSPKRYQERCTHSKSVQYQRLESFDETKLESLR